MTSEQSQALEFPAMLHGPVATIRRKVTAEAHWWAREYLETGVFPQPRRMRQVMPGEVLLMHSAAKFGAPHSCWRMHMFVDVFVGLNEGVPEDEYQRTRAAFESFCLSTPCSAERMANRFAALLRFWEVLQVPRYAFWSFERKSTLEELLDNIYRKTLEAWCPRGPATVREHLALTVERMARATREDCLEAVLRVMPVIMKGDTDLKHHEVLSDPDFLRERLRALPPKKFESLSSADKYAVAVQLSAWDREVGRH
jgi:hypothetical protein